VVLHMGPNTSECLATYSIMKVAFFPSGRERGFVTEMLIAHPLDWT